MTRSYEEFLVLQATEGTSDTRTPSTPLVITGNDMDLSTVYFFLPKYVGMWGDCIKSHKLVVCVCVCVCALIYTMQKAS